MKFEALKEVGTRAIGRTLLQTKKYAPEILTGVGIVAVVAGAVMAAKSTLELEAELVYSQDLREKTKALREERSEEEYSTETYTKDIAISYVRTAQAVTRVYGPAVAVELTGVVCLLAAHGIMRKRNASLAMAYSAVHEAFRAYRARVIEEFGPEKDFDYKNGIREEVVEETDDKGKIKKVKKLVQDPNKYSGYAKFFDETNPNWERNAETNLFFLRCQQNWANDKLHAKGHLFLNEVYDALGIDRTGAGAVVGWMISKEGDNFVDFGIFDEERPRVRAFVNGLEKSVLLDFNVDGVIYDKI